MNIYTYIHTYIHTYKQTNKQTNIDTYIHTYIHTYRRLKVLPEPTKMRTKRILRIHSPDSVNDKYWLKRDRKWTTFGLKTKKYIKLYKTFRSLDLRQLQRST